MIELSDREYWKNLSYHDGLLYCSLLDIDDKNDWRMIKNDDEWDEIKETVGFGYTIWHVWVEDDISESGLDYDYGGGQIVIPVRDI